MQDSTSGSRTGLKAELRNAFWPVRYILGGYLVLLIAPFLLLGPIPMFSVPLIIQTLVFGIVGALMVVLVTAIARGIESRRNVVLPAAALGSPRSLGALDVFIVLGLVVGELLFVAAHEWAQILPAMPMEMLCMCLKIMGGITLALWSRSPGHAAILAAAGQYLCSDILLTTLFMVSPTSQFQYGPEAAIFAMAESVGNLSTFLFGSALLYGAWRVTMACATPRTTPEVEAAGIPV